MENLSNLQNKSRAVSGNCLFDSSFIKGAAVRKNLKDARRKAGMTQKEVAEYLGMTERAYQRIENGERIGMIEAWDLLEDLFKIHQRVLREISSN